MYMQAFYKLFDAVRLVAVIEDAVGGRPTATET